MKDELKEVMGRMSDDEVLALCLMSGEQSLVEWGINLHSKDELKAALSVLERYNRKFPDDEDCRVATELVRKHLTQTEGGEQ